jgi:CxxC-x17-CxxC domain-containing protein
MEYQDRLLTCADCNGEFIFSASEQLVFFFGKQFRNDSRHCKHCRIKRLGRRVSQGSDPQALSLSRTETRAICYNCSVETILPLKPIMGRPVLCRPCIQSAQRSTAAVPKDSELQS